MTTSENTHRIDDTPLSRSALWFTIFASALAWTWVAVTTGGWANKWVLLAVLGVVGVVIAGLFLSWRRSIPRVPDRWIWTTRPEHREYWTAPGNRAEFARRIVADLEWIGAATLLLLTVLVLVIGSATGTPEQPWALALPIALFVAGIIGLGVSMVVGPRYRPQEP